MDSLKIAHICDIHVGLENEKPYGIDVRDNFLKVMHDIMDYAPDLVVFGGDMSFREDHDAAYQWLKDQLADLKIACFFIAGNHDHVPKLADYFSLQDYVKNGKLYYQCAVNHYPLFFLDSSDYSLDNEQLNWLYENQKQLPKEAILFLHHPPAYCGCYYMDHNYPLKNIDQVQGILLKCSQIKTIFCGHYHIAKKILSSQKQIFITPSTFFQIDAVSRELKVSSQKPGWRLIECNDQGINSKVIYPG